MDYNIDELKHTIRGINEIKSFKGSRKDLYNLISKHNPLAIIDNRHASIEINNIKYIAVLSKVNSKYKLKGLIDITNVHQEYIGKSEEGYNQYKITNDVYYVGE